MDEPRFHLPAANYALPHRPEPAINPGSFVVCPLALVGRLPFQPQCWQSFVYQVALNAAAESCRPSLPERDLLAVWN